MLLFAQFVVCIGNDFICLFYTALACMRVGCCVRRRSLGCVGLAGCWSCSPRWRCRRYWRLALGTGRDLFPPSLAERLEFSLSARGLVLGVHGFNVLMWRAASKRVIRCRWLHVQGKWILYSAGSSKGLMGIHIYKACVKVCLLWTLRDGLTIYRSVNHRPRAMTSGKGRHRRVLDASVSDRPPAWPHTAIDTPVGPIPVDIFLSRELELEPSASTRRLRAKRHHFITAARRMNTTAFPRPCDHHTPRFESR